MKKRYTLIFTILFISLCYAQNKDIERTINGLQKDQLLFEKVFIHTNKTKYAVNDVIWFKAYVVTNDNKPSVKTTVLYVSLFSESGVLIETKNVLIQNGVGVGQYELFGEVKKGTYYIQANTNYMKNFGEENKYIQKIQIDEATEKTTDGIANYDVQVFPQGGYLLENVENILGIKALINGRNSDYTGVIVDSENKTIASFKNEHLGMTKTKFHYLPSETYKAIFKLNDTTITIKIPKAKTTGLTLNTLNTTEAILNLELRTNLESIKKSKTDYTLLFHQNNKLLDYVAVNMVDTALVKLEINKASFFNGVNTVTVFEGDVPVLERKFFVYKKDTKQEVSLEMLSVFNDSTVYKLKLKDNKVIGNVSVSVLSERANYQQTTTIESAFLLTPYVKGYVENPAYYFNAENDKRFQHLDLLLLTQGWTQYTTRDYINNLNPKYKYNFEQGFSLKGKVGTLKSNNLGLLAKNNQVVAETFLNSTPEFEFKNLLVYKGDSIKVSFLKGIDKSIAEKPRNITFDSIKNKIPILKYHFQDTYFTPKKADEQLEDIRIKTEQLNLENVNSLDEVEVVGKAENKYYLEDKAFINKYREQIFDLGAYNRLNIPEYFIKKNRTLGEYLFNERGYKRYKFPNYHKQFIINGTNKKGNVIIMIVSLDGFLVTPTNSPKISLEEFYALRMDDIDRILYKSPRRISTGYPRLAIFTTDNYKKGIKELFKDYVFENGYDASKKYYSPINGYTFENDNKEIDWKPNLVTNASGEIAFKIKKNQLSETILLSIQGFTNTGKLISDTILIK